MLQIRLGGSLDEANQLLDALRAIGAEVDMGGIKDRGHFHHVYAVARMPGSPAAGEEPVRVRSQVGEPAAALSSGRRRLPGRRR
jgi:hypothetical protein